MDTRRTSEIWDLRIAGICLFASLLFSFIIFQLAPRVGMLWMSHDSYEAFRHSTLTKLFYYAGTRLLVLGVCIYFTKVRSRQDFVSSFALLASPFRLWLLSALSGICVAFTLKLIEPGASGHIWFQTYFDVSSIALLLGPFAEEVIMRGFFYRAFRNVMPVAFSILLAFGIDALLFHYGTFRNLQALFGVAVVNVGACLFREHSKSLWPAISFHVAYNIPFAILACMR